MLTAIAPSRGTAGAIASIAGSFVVNLAMFALAFRVLTPGSVPFRHLRPGAVIAGTGWTVLQTLGGLLIANQLRHSSQVYGLFGVVLGLVSFLALAGTILVYAAEVNVVRARHLWPRSIAQTPLVPADRAVFTDLAKEQERVPEQRVDVSYDDR
jgi:uncharacterized BrkB/YihY/UPF0761 family membrane protein